MRKVNSGIYMNYDLNAKPQLGGERQRTKIINATILTGKMNEFSYKVNLKNYSNYIRSVKMPRKYRPELIYCSFSIQKKILLNAFENQYKLIF